MWNRGTVRKTNSMMIVKPRLYFWGAMKPSEKHHWLVDLLRHSGWPTGILVIVEDQHIHV